MDNRGSVLLFLIIITLTLFRVSPTFSAEATSSSNSSKPNIPSHYYFVGAFLAHPCMKDIKLGLRYAQKKFGVQITTLGPQGGDFERQVQAMKKAIVAQPEGIIIPLWAKDAVPYIRTAREHGIPVVAIEAAPQEHSARGWTIIRLES